MKTLQFFIPLMLFLQSCDYTTVKILTSKDENKFKIITKDTIIIKSLSVIDRYSYKPSIFRKSTTTLVKNLMPTKHKLEDAFLPLLVFFTNNKIGNFQNKY